VHEQERRALSGREDADPSPPPLVVAFLEPRQEGGRIRHLDRLSFEDYELGGDKAGCPLNTCLHPQELNPRPSALSSAAGFFVLEDATTLEDAMTLGDQ
jgi:hypothetical protein